MGNLTHRLYERLTGRPYITTRSMAEEYGPPPAVQYPELLDYTDTELLAEIRARRAALARVREEVSR